MKSNRSLGLGALAALAGAALLALSACSSQRYEPEPLAPPAAGSAPAAAETAGGLRYSGLVEYGRGMLGIGRSDKGEGAVTVTGDHIAWVNNKDSDRNFAIKADVLESVWMTCAKRPGKNLCLDLGMKTLTGLEFHFRDQNWAGGENRQISQLFDYLRLNFAHVQYDQKTVDEVD